jgi:hypothetical protein
MTVPGRPATMPSMCAVQRSSAAFLLQQRAHITLTRSQFLNEMGVTSVSRTGGLTAAERAPVMRDVANLD